MRRGLPTMHRYTCSRRTFLRGVGASAGLILTRPISGLARSAPTGRVAVGMCREYGPGVAAAMGTMFDQLGGVGKLVRGKTVAIKLNLTGMAWDRMGYRTPGETYWVRPDVVGAAVHLFSQAGAQRVRLLESPMSTAEPLEEFMLRAGWEPRDFERAGTRVEFEIPTPWDRKEVCALHGSWWRVDVQRLRPQSFLPGLTSSCRWQN